VPENRRFAECFSGFDQALPFKVLAFAPGHVRKTQLQIAAGDVAHTVGEQCCNQADNCAECVRHG